MLRKVVKWVKKNYEAQHPILLANAASRANKKKNGFISSGNKRGVYDFVLTKLSNC